MLSLSAVDRFVHRMSIINTLVDKVVSKIVPTIPVAASCPGGWYRKETSGDALHCAIGWLYGCGSGYKICEHCYHAKYYYSGPPYYCEADVCECGDQCQNISTCY